MEADTEHEQDDADIRKLSRQPLVSHETGRKRADHDACDQVTNEWRDPQAMRNRPENKGQAYADDKGSNER
jgi:hypothetical protein